MPYAENINCVYNPAHMRVEHFTVYKSCSRSLFRSDLRDCRGQLGVRPQLHLEAEKTETPAGWEKGGGQTVARASSASRGASAVHGSPSKLKARPLSLAPPTRRKPTRRKENVFHYEYCHFTVMQVLENSYE